MKLANRILFLLVAALAMFAWSGCGGGCPTTSLSSSAGAGGTTGGTSTGGSVCGPATNPGGGGGNTSSFLYYINNTNLSSTNILGASLSTAGTFANLTSFTPPTVPGNTGTDMVIVNKKFLYLPENDSTVQAFAIDHTTGALTSINGSPFATAGADSIASDPAGHFLFVGNDHTGLISVFQINATTGALTAAPGSPFSAFNLDFVHVLAVDGTGKFLYASQGLAALPVYGFSIDQNTGALSQVVGSPFTLGVALVRSDFTGKFAVGLTGIAGDNHLSVFAINASTGALSPVSNSPFATTMSTPENLRIHPSSQFVYTFGLDTNSTASAIEGFSIDSSTGALTPLTGSPFTSLPVVADCKWDQGGGEAFCANGAANAFSVLNTSTSTGALTHTVTDLTVTNDAVPFAPTN
jgi:6-phosphogluconolactonase